ncbi:MAG: histidine kinase [Gemmatimonadetes bacterium]|nr:histidine kinase [Gemmatimonadota bacterium]
MVAPSGHLPRASTPPFWAVVAGAWTFFGVMYGCVWTAAARYPESAFRWTIPTALAVAWCWALLTPLLFRLTRAVTPSRVGWVVSLGSHTAAAMACAALLTALLRQSMAFLAEWSPEPYVSMLFYWFDVWLFVYASLVVVGHALTVRRRYVDRTVRAHLLEAQLSRAQLQYLELQLQPHFLFNALNAIQELAHEAPHAAERMLRRLHALLAISLERSGRDEVTLDEELAALEPYLDIQRTRFSDWLDVGVAVPPSLRRALVPHLILQPLVENAIRHGLSVRQAPGTVTVHAARADDRLILRVEDDGVGLRQAQQRDGATRREGIGLRNASERLRQLYGSSHRFELREAPTGGVTVELELPYREGEAVARTAASPMTVADAMAATDLDDPSTWRTGEYSTVFPDLEVVRPEAPPEAREAEVVPTPQWQASGSFRAARRATPEATGAFVSAEQPVLAPTPGLSWRAWSGIGALWFAMAVLWTNQMVLYSASMRPSDDYSWLGLARLQVATSIIWLALSPVVVALARRFRIDATNWMRILPLHALFGVCAGLVHTGVMQLSGLSQLPVLSPGNMNPLTGDFFVYFGLLAWSHARDFVSWYRARELEGARLSARIAGSRFQALRVQLRPQFLLATLDLLAELVHRDVPRTERLITRLADTLRLTLELGRDATSSLKQELELLQACVETHRDGIRPGVQLVANVPTSLLPLRIPSRLVCTMVDELLAADSLNPGAPLTVRVDVERVADVTRIRLKGDAAWGGRAGGSHAWWRTKSVAEAAVADAGALVSVTFPDRASAVLLVADARVASNPEAAPEWAAAVA